MLQNPLDGSGSVLAEAVAFLDLGIHPKEMRQAIVVVQLAGHSV